MKTQVNNPKIISSKFLGIREVSGDNFLFYVSTTPWLQLSV